MSAVAPPSDFGDWIASLEVARGTAPEPGRLSALLMRRGAMSVRYYAPAGRDPQTPHDQDEIYIVVSGSGTVVSGPSETDLERRAFSSGDAIFIPARHVHRFEHFTPDFATWVIFFDN